MTKKEFFKAEGRLCQMWSCPFRGIQDICSPKGQLSCRHCPCHACREGCAQPPHRSCAAPSQHGAPRPQPQAASCVLVKAVLKFFSVPKPSRAFLSLPNLLTPLAHHDLQIHTALQGLPGANKKACGPSFGGPYNCMLELAFWQTWFCLFLVLQNKRVKQSFLASLGDN